MVSSASPPPTSPSPLDPYRLPVVLCYLFGLCSILILRAVAFSNFRTQPSYKWVYVIDGVSLLLGIVTFVLVSREVHTVNGPGTESASPTVKRHSMAPEILTLVSIFIMFL
ncbi:hypothetical protein KIPB_012660, partial [Kipferlia bialata]|eukprot:g12660.t1